MHSEPPWPHPRRQLCSQRVWGQRSAQGLGRKGQSGRGGWERGVMSAWSVPAPADLTTGVTAVEPSGQDPANRADSRSVPEGPARAAMLGGGQPALAPGIECTVPAQPGPSRAAPRLSGDLGHGPVTQLAHTLLTGQPGASD